MRRQLGRMYDVEWLLLFRQVSILQTIHVLWRHAGLNALVLEDIAEEMACLQLICFQDRLT